MRMRGSSGGGAGGDDQGFQRQIWFLKFEFFRYEEVVSNEGS